MESDNKEKHTNFEPIVASPLQPKEASNTVVTPKTPRQVRLKKAVIACFVTAIITSLLVSAGLAGAFLLGKNYSANNIEEKRQTVVQEGEVIADVSQRVGQSVVSIVTEQESTVSSLYSGPRTRTSQAAGTGLVIDSSGLVLTNKHVVPEGTSKVQIVMSDGTKYEDATVLGRDPLNDIAVVKVANAKNFKAATLADSDSVRTGQKVIAIGNALGQFQNTVTSGIISGIGRPIEASDQSGSASEQLTNLFQTDTAINSGNSGGPLLNFNGEVIGINTAVAADAQNIGFSIPINEAKGIIEGVKSTGKVTRPFLGVQFTMITPDVAKEFSLTVQKGAYVSTDAGSIVAGGPAEKAGIKSGDVITKVNNIELSESVSLVSAIGRFKVGDTVELTVIRSGKEQKIKVTLSEAPSN